MGFNVAADNDDADDCNDNDTTAAADDKEDTCNDAIVTGIGISRRPRKGLRAWDILGQAVAVSEFVVAWTAHCSDFGQSGDHDQSSVI